MQVKGLPIDQHFEVDPRDWRDLDPDEDESDDDEDIHCPESVKMMLGLDPDELFGETRNESKFVSDEQRQAFFGHYGKDVLSAGLGTDEQPKQNDPKQASPKQADPAATPKATREQVITGIVTPPDHLAAQSFEHLKSIGKDARNDLRRYSKDDYADLNSTMRECPPDFKCVGGEEKKLMDSLEKSLQSAPKFKEPVQVYRGLNFVDPDLHKAFMAHIESHLGSGKEFSMPSITSTSISPSAAIEGFVHEGSADDTTHLAVLFNIKAKSGLYIEKLTKQKGEHEVIQSSRTRYRVTGVEHVGYRYQGYDDAETVRTIHLEEI